MDEKIKKCIHCEIANATVTVWVANDFKGTGFLITPDGYVLTAYHCLGEYTSQIIVKTRFGDILMAELDKNKYLPHHDIAVLKVNFHTPHFLPLGKISKEHRGDEVVAMGYPAGNLPDNDEIGEYYSNISKFSGKDKIELPDAIKGRGQSGGAICQLMIL